MILITIFLQKFAENLTFNVIFYLINRYKNSYEKEGADTHHSLSANSFFLTSKNLISYVQVH